MVQAIRLTAILLPQFLECREYRYEPLHPAVDTFVKEALVSLPLQSTEHHHMPVLVLILVFAGSMTVENRSLFSINYPVSGFILCFFFYIQTKAKSIMPLTSINAF